MKKSCENCNHSTLADAANEEDDYPIFECRYNPPVVSEFLLKKYEAFGIDERNIYSATIYPVVCDDGLCSKWEAR